MKTITLSILAIMIFSLTSQKQNIEKIINGKNSSNFNLECPAPPAFTETVINKNKKKVSETVSENIDQSWYSKALEKIQKDEYEISYKKELDVYQSPNRKNNIRFIYQKNGFTAKPRDLNSTQSHPPSEASRDTEYDIDKIEEWSIKVELSNIERNKSEENSEWSKENLKSFASNCETVSSSMMNSEFKLDGNKASIENEILRIDYTNDENGMRQDFIIKQRPQEEGKLRLNLSADTKLKMIVGADALMFKDEKGIDKMKYSALKCWDANGKELRAYFDKPPCRFATSPLSQRGDRGGFAIVVNDEEAVYPITIDPLSTSPSWSVESNQSGAQFGFSVSTAGDVNGDGYSDVIVGAPFYDNGVTDAGKTFVYYGSSTGLSVTANWTVEGNSNQINQGYSVSTAGDVNGDGFSDVIVSVKNINLPWVSQNSGTIQNLQDVYFTSPSKGWAVGAGGVIVATTDGGLNWTAQSSGTTNDFRSNWFTTPDSGWAVGVAGTIKVTTDGGASWATQTSGTTAPLTCVYFRTSQEGYVLGGSGLIRKTTNAGLNWTAQSSGLTIDLRDVVFTSSTTGWVVGGNGRILKTTNGGTNWVIQTSGTTQFFRAVYFSSALTGMAFGQGGTFNKTTDGGTTWSTTTIGTFQDLYGCSFTSPLVGWTVGLGNTVLKTTDGGSSWISKNSGISGDLRSVFFSAPDSGFAVGSGGILYNYNASAPSTGSYAFVYNGSSTGLSATPSSNLTGSSGISTINNIVSTAGDINGDGYSDVIIGSPNSNSGTGAVLIYHGSATGSQTTPNTTLTGSQSAALYGISASTAGDADGDGYSDIIVGSSDFDNGQTNEGIAYVYRGSASGLITTPYWTYESNQANSRFGASVSTAGDVNGDGYSDIVAGSPDYFLSTGRALLFLSSGSGISVSPNWTYETVNFGEQLGSSVSTAGDVNGDGYADVIVGSPHFTNGENNEGRALVFQGSATGLSIAPVWTNEGNQVSANYGNSVFTAGDINGDGFSDVIVGAKLNDNGETDEGIAFVYNGSSSGLSSSSDWTSASGQTGSYFGYSVASAGDVNGDGYSDVIIGAPSYDNGETDEGKFFAFYGSASGLSATPDYSAIEGNQTGAQLGFSVSTAGDVNGDGYSDVLIGVPYFDQGQADEGLVYLVYGSASGLELGIAWEAQSNQTGALFGNSVATAGDVNGDGYSDVIIGANKYDNGQTDEGKVFLWNGASSGLGVNGTPLNADWTAESNQAGSDFGISAATAGDVNGDGFSDVVIGADKFDNGHTDEGKFYAYYGTASGLPAIPDYSAIEGNQTGANLGYSVSSAGDVNGDGYSDVLIGIPYFDLGQIDEGLVYAVYGSSSGLELGIAWSGESNQANANYGNSVSSAGDVNGDGYSDVVIGAVTYDNGELDEGGAFLYHGSSSGLGVNGTPLNADWTGESNQLVAYFGKCVSAAGDVNGDGYSDVIIGSTQYTSGMSNEGAAIVYYGNNGAGLRSTVQQYKPGSADVVSSGGLTGTNGQIRLNTFGKSPYGRADGKIVFEYKDNGIPFSGTILTNSVSSSGSGSNTDLGTPITGVQLNKDISGLTSSKEYKWRARLQYSPVNNPYQKLGPWKYYNNYIPSPLGDFRPSNGLPDKVLNLAMLIQGFYDAGTNTMVQDTARVYLRNSFSPYAVIDSSIAYLSSSGAGAFSFSNSSNGVNYYIQLKHRNSIETWSNTTPAFVSNDMTYNFTSAITQAFGSNMPQIDISPVKYGIYSGDINQDGTIDAGDLSQAENDAANSLSGYEPADVTGDDFVDAADMSIVENNVGLGVSAIYP